MMRNLVSGERITSVAGHGVPGEKGAQKADGSLWGRPWTLDAEVESVHRGQGEISGLLEMAETGPGRPLKDGLCRGGRPAGCAAQLSAGHMGTSWFFRNLFQRKDSESQRILGSRNRNRDTRLLAQNT